MKSITFLRLKDALKALSDNEDLIQKTIWKIDEIIQEDQKYNGHKNYETWMVSLHLNNDQYLQELALGCECMQDLKDLVYDLVDLDNEDGQLNKLLAKDFIGTVFSDVHFFSMWEDFQKTKAETEECEEDELTEETLDTINEINEA